MKKNNYFWVKALALKFEKISIVIVNKNKLRISRNERKRTVNQCNNFKL